MDKYKVKVNPKAIRELESIFQYIANEITYTGDYELPDSKPRMSVQWER